MRWALVVLLLSFCTGPGVLSGAEPTAAVIKRAKEATALVRIPAKNGRHSFGTAFCIAPTGLFVTNQHVSKEAKQGDNIMLILNCGEKDQREIVTREILSSEKYDLALLQVAEGGTFTALELGNSDDAFDTMQLTALGFPFGDALTLNADHWPSISLNVGRITSLRKNAGELELLQVDAVLNPGNSGGPMIDHEGKVIGIAQAGLRGTGVNFAIPVKRLANLLSKPYVTFEPAVLDLTKVDQLQSVKVRALVVPRPNKAYDLELTLTEKDKPARTFVETVDDQGIANFQFAPMAGPVTKTFNVTAFYRTGKVIGTVREMELTIGDTQVPLADIKHYDHRERPEIPEELRQKSFVRLKTDKNLEGKLLAPNPLKVDVGSDEIAVDPEKVTAILFEEQPLRPFELTYQIRLLVKDQLLGEDRGTLKVLPPDTALKGAAGTKASPPDLRPVNSDSQPAVANTQPVVSSAPPVVSSRDRQPQSVSLPEPSGKDAVTITKETPLESDRVTTKLPGMIDEVAAGGNGRFLFFHIKKVQKLAVFDVEVGDVTGYIELPSNNILYAASAESLVVIERDQNLATRYDLLTLKKEFSQLLNLAEKVHSLTIGYGSRGLGLLVTPAGPRLFDMHNLTFLSEKPIKDSDWSSDHPLQVRSSADGLTYAAWQPDSGRFGLRLLQVGSKGDVTCKYKHAEAGALLPTARGNALYTTTGIYDTQFKRVAAEKFGIATCLPSYDPGYFLVFTGVQPRWAHNGADQRPRLAYYSTAGNTLLFSTTDLKELFYTDSDGLFEKDIHVLPIDKRVHFFPSANLLLTITHERDTILLRRLRIIDEIKKANGE